MAPTAVVWVITAAGLAGLLAASAVQAGRALRDGRRAAARAAAFGDLPLFAALDGAAADVARIEAALAALPPLLARAQAAVSAIRRGPIPPELRATMRRLRSQVR